MILIISGFDPSGGAGILQDIKILSLIGLKAYGVLSSYTIQNEEKVFSIIFRKWEDIDKELSVLKEPTYIKIGVINPSFVRLIREKYPKAKIIWNVILNSSSGYLFENEKDVLNNLRYSDYIILNNEEAKRLKIKPSENNIITCGHQNSNKVKVLYNDKVFSIDKISGKFHGTGCSFSSLITGFLSYGYNIEEAILISMEIMNKILSLSNCNYIETEKLARKWMEIDVLERLENIIPKIEKIALKTIPEVGQNISYALPWSKKEEEVAKFPGRIRLKERKPIFVSPPSFKDKSHTARMAIIAKENFPHIRCVTNIKYDSRYIEIAKKKGFRVYKYDRNLEPENIFKKDGKSMQWMINKVIEEMGILPDIIYDEGWFGKEAMIRVFGRSPEEVIKKVSEMIKE